MTKKNVAFSDLGALSKAPVRCALMGQSEKLPPAFATAALEWREAERHVAFALQRYESAPCALNQLALSASWLALGIAVNQVGKSASLCPGSRAAVSCAATAFARFEGLHFRLERGGLLPRLGVP